MRSSTSSALWAAKRARFRSSASRTRANSAMQKFANLLDCLTTTPSRNGKLALLVEYFRTAPDPDRGFALGALTDGLFSSLPLRRAIGELMAQKIDPVLYAMSRDYVGDTAETVSLLWPEPKVRRPAPS